MTSIRLTTRAELKKIMRHLYESIEENNPREIKKVLIKLETNITIYYNTRGLECERFDARFIEIRNLLKRYSNSHLFKKKLLSYIFKLDKELKYDKVFAADGTEKQQDPIKLLKLITDDLLDDYSSFNLTGGQDVIEENKEALELIKDDLLEVRELEPFFKDKSVELCGNFNLLCKAVNLCLMIIPQVNDITISAKNATVFRQSFEALFNVATEIFVPIKSDPKIEEIKASAKTTTGELADKETEDKSLTQLADDAGVDLEEMERKAKGGFFDNAELNEK